MSTNSEEAGAPTLVIWYSENDKGEGNETIVS